VVSGHRFNGTWHSGSLSFCLCLCLWLAIILIFLIRWLIKINIKFKINKYLKIDGVPIKRRSKLRTVSLRIIDVRKSFPSFARE
jgi:hypothetical protein